MSKHVLYTVDDFKKNPHGSLYESVVNGGLRVCKRCGDYERGLLVNPKCVPRYIEESRE